MSTTKRVEKQTTGGTRRKQRLARLRNKILAGKYRVSNMELAKALLLGQ